MADSYNRIIEFESIRNFRDLGGYRSRNGRKIDWRRLFRSGELGNMTENDMKKLRDEIGITTVIDLRSTRESEQQGTEIFTRAGIRHYNLPFTSGGDGNRERGGFPPLSNLGELYLLMLKREDLGKRLVEALEIIAETSNHPLVFHCQGGKDRTGILSAILLSILDVEDKDIIEDYTLSARYIEKLRYQLNDSADKEGLARRFPDYFFDVIPESMALFLSTVRREYGSIRGYVEKQGADDSLFHRLEEALLI
jgi:protein-tyrosine phosphatase